MQNNSDLMMLLDTIGDLGASLLFGMIVLALYGMLILAILFCGLAVRVAWRWLTCATWRDVIVLGHRRALR